MAGGKGYSFVSGHSKWQSRIEQRLPVDESMVQYTCGYILALEDVLKDAEDSHCLDELVATVKQTIEQAEHTLRLLQEKLDQ